MRGCRQGKVPETVPGQVHHEDTRVDIHDDGATPAAWIARRRCSYPQSGWFVIFVSDTGS